MKYIKEFLVSSFSGLISLLAINLFGSFIGVNLYLSQINIIISALLGVPGVTLALIFNNFLI